MVLALLALLVVPPFIDWNDHRAAFEREASRLVGRPVTIGADASLRILPFPSIELEDLAIAGPDGAVLVTIERLRMDAELVPLLTGDVRVFSTEIETPVLRVPLSAAGEIVLPVSEDGPSLVADIALERVAVRGGRIEIENAATGGTEVLDEIEAVLSAESLAGPFDGEGTLVSRGVASRFSLGGQALSGEGPAGGAGAMALRFDFDAPALQASLGFDGTARLDAGVPRLSGLATMRRPAAARPPAPVTAAAPDEPLWRRIVDRILWRDAPEPAVPPALPETGAGDAAPLSASGRIEAGPGAAIVTDLRLEAGGGDSPYLLTGGGSLTLDAEPDFSLSLAGEPLILGEGEADGDEGSDEAAPVEGQAAPPVFAERVASLKAIVETVPRPSIPGRVTLSLPVISAGEQAIRNFGLAAVPVPSGWRIEALSAELPGRTLVEADGVLNLDEGVSYEGNLLLASRQPSGFADWISSEVDPALRTLPSAGFAARVRLEENRQVFEDLELNIGGDTVTGRLERAAGMAGGSVSASVSGGRLDVDAGLALARLFGGPETSLGEVRRVSLDLAAGPIVWNGVSAERVDGRLLYDGEALDIDALRIADLAGADIAVDGRIESLREAASGTLETSFSAERPEAFLRLLDARFPGTPLVEALEARAALLAPLALSGTLRTVLREDAPWPSLVVRLDGEAGGSKLDIAAAIENGLKAATESGRFGVDLRIENDRPDVLLRQVGIEAIETGAPGPLEFEMSLSAGATGPVVASASLRAPGSEATADGLLDLTPEGVAGGEMGVSLASDDLAPWLVATATSLAPLGGLPVDLSGAASWEGEAWALNAIEGTLADIIVSGELHVRDGGGTRGRLALSTLSLPWLAGLVYGVDPLDAARGDGVWDATDFAASSPLPVLGDLSLAVTSEAFELRPGLAVDDFAATIETGNGALRIASATGRIADGRVAFGAEMRNAAGIGGLSLNAEFADLDLGAIWPVATDPARFGGTIGIEGTGRSAAGLVASSSGAGRIEIRDARLPGVPRDAFAPILAAADAEGFEANEAAVARLLGEAAARSAFPVPRIEAQFSVDGGTLRFAPAEVRGANETLRLDARLDLSDLAVAGEARLRFDPGAEAIDGAAPEVSYAIGGTLANPSLSGDAQGFTNFLSVRALQREEARVAAIQERARESARLRREARYFRWRETAAREAEAARRAISVEDETETAPAEEAEAAPAEEAEVEPAEDVEAAPAEEAEAAPAETGERVRVEDARDVEGLDEADEDAEPFGPPAPSATVVDPAAAPGSPPVAATGEEEVEGPLPDVTDIPTPSDRPPIPADEPVPQASRPEPEPPPAVAPAPPPPAPARAAQRDPPRLNLDLAAPAAPAAPDGGADFPSLPGVQNPLEF